MFSSPVLPQPCPCPSRILRSSSKMVATCSLKRLESLGIRLRLSFRRMLFHPRVHPQVRLRVRLRLRLRMVGTCSLKRLERRDIRLVPFRPMHLRPRLWPRLMPVQRPVHQPLLSLHLRLRRGRWYRGSEWIKRRKEDELVGKQSRTSRHSVEKARELDAASRSQPKVNSKKINNAISCRPIVSCRCIS
jgi:hypothetical protein